MGENIQNSTNDQNATGVDYQLRPYSELTLTQQFVVDYKALNGLITLDEPEIGPDGKQRMFKKMTMTELASKLGVSRDALYKAMNSMSNFWDLVAQRRKELASESRLAVVHEAWFLKAAKGDWQHLNAYLTNFDPNYVPPTQKVEHGLENAGITDVLDIIRERKRKQAQAIEGEVIDESPKTENQA